MCAAIVYPEIFLIAAGSGASRNVIHAFYSAAVRDTLSLRSLRYHSDWIVARLSSTTVS